MCAATRRAKRPQYSADTTIAGWFADPASTEIKQIESAGWTFETIDTYSHGQITPYFGVATRTITNPTGGSTGGVSASGNIVTPFNPLQLVESDADNNPSSGATVVTHYGQPIAVCDSTAALSAWTQIPSIQQMRADSDDSLVVAVDTEFYYVADGERLILTWQFAFQSPANANTIEQVVFFSLDGTRLKLSRALSWLIEEYSLTELPFCLFRRSGIDYKSTRRWSVPVLATSGRKAGQVYIGSYSSQDAAIVSTCDDNVRSYLSQFRHDHKRKRDAEGNPLDVAGYDNVFREADKQALPVTLVFHAAKADLSTFYDGDYETDLMVRVSDIQGGLVSLKSLSLHPHGCRRYWVFYPISLSVRDTMCFAPDGKKKLFDLGEAVGVPKLDVADDDKNDMLGFLGREPSRFFDYAINDSVVTIAYACELWGWNKSMPVTVTSASTKVAVSVIKAYFDIEEEEFDGKFRGLVKVKRGLIKVSDQAGYIEDTALVPVNADAKILQDYAQNAYHGGYNGCNLVGYYTNYTFDFDLENAYPTCMALVPDIDWLGVSGKLVVREWHAGEPMLLQDFRSPFDPIWGYITFRFPPTVKYPCIPVNVGGSLVFPRSSDGLDGVYAAAPDIYLALRLGAEVRVSDRGRSWQAAYWLDESGHVSFSLQQVVKQLVTDRRYAQQSYGKKSIADLLLKIAVNSLYGKTAQDVVDKRTWDAFREEMTNIGGSSITSPTHASLTTAGVRAVLLAAMNELDVMGYTSYSVTTDGFITDAPEAVMNHLDLFGFNQLFRSARVALTGDDSMWAVKHEQDDLLNLTTRGNVSLSLGGVCAHNSYISGEEKDGYADRLAYQTATLSRTGRVSSDTAIWSGFRALSDRESRRDFAVAERTRSLSMDFDLKRKPVRSSFATVNPVVAGQTYEIANFNTEPYDTVDDYVKYKRAGKTCIDGAGLRTMANWSVFWARLSTSNNSTGVRITDLDWSIIVSCVRGWKYHGWSIPYLDGGHSVAEKLAFINCFNMSEKRFRQSDWDNAARRARQNDILGYDVCDATLDAMRAAGDAMPDLDDDPVTLPTSKGGDAVG